MKLNEEYNKQLKIQKTQQSNIKSHVCHFKALQFKMTIHELIGQNMFYLAKHMKA